jgi:predicted  nucleic acid-binding Zn-ribbon protein
MKKLEGNKLTSNKVQLSQQEEKDLYKEISGVQSVEKLTADEKAKKEVIDDLQQRLDEAMTANLNLNTQLCKVEDERHMLAKMLSDVNANTAALTRELNALNKQSTSYSDIIKQKDDEIAVYQKRLASGIEKSAMNGDYAVIDGKPYKVVYRALIKFVAEAWHKRYVGENQTAVVLEREGE